MMSNAKWHASNLIKTNTSSGYKVGTERIQEEAGMAKEKWMDIVR